MVLPQKTSFNSSFLQFLNQKGWEKTAPVEEPKFVLEQQQKTKLIKELGNATPPFFIPQKQIRFHLIWSIKMVSETPKL